jgi:hypothetical protein
MLCPNCEAAMDLFHADTWNAQWVCLFDGQVVWPGPRPWGDPLRAVVFPMHPSDY